MTSRSQGRGTRNGGMLGKLAHPLTARTTDVSCKRRYTISVPQTLACRATGEYDLRNGPLIGLRVTHCGLIDALVTKPSVCLAKEHVI
jgi:hypothetical protein